MNFGPVEVISVKSSINYKAGSNFASVYVKKDLLEIHFQLGRVVDEYPVGVITRLSKNRVLHAIAIDELDQIDDFLLKLLRESYALILGT